MKIIDQTPYQDENGEIGFFNRMQGTLKYGLSWYASLQAQKSVIAILNRVLEKGYTLLRNQPLGASGIIVPIILVGASGIYVMDVTPLNGFYRARGDEWGTVTNGVFQPAPINVLKRTAQLAQVLQVFFDRQGVKLSAPIEPVLLASDPGMHIDSVRPVVRIVLSDAIDRFAASLLSARPVYSAAAVNDLVDRIQNPRSKRQDQAEPAPVDDAFATQDETPFPAMESSRMQSILNAPQSDALIETGEPGIDFALEDEAEASRQPTVLVSNPYSPESGEGTTRATAPARKRILGLYPWQIAVLVGMFLCWCLVMAASITYFVYIQP